MLHSTAYVFHDIVLLEPVDSNLEVLKSLSNCTVALFEVRYQGGNDTDKKSIHGKATNANQRPLAWAPKMRPRTLDNSKLPHGDCIGF